MKRGSVDERVVQMQFDNRKFESGIKTSMNSIERLKQAFNFKGVNEAMNQLEESSNSISFNGLKNAFNTAVTDMSVWAIAKFTLIQNAINRLIDSTERLVKSMSIDQIAAGWNKFSDKTVSVGTLIAQGYDMSTVEEQLERLQWFSDETSYNFVDMTSNVAKFTATGKALDESVTALEGIANWAALSGQNAQTASRAMYQISQAMGAGVMRKEDYKSIQNVSMDTKEFREQAIKAAVAIGTLKDNLDGTYTSLINNQGAFTRDQFSEHLTQDAWFTSEVMMEVFTSYSKATDQIMDYANEHEITASEAIEALGDDVDAFGLKAFRAAQEARTWTDVVDSVKDAVSSGWATTFEMIFGNYEEQRVMWTKLANQLYDIFAEPNNQRNAMLEEWRKLGGREDLLKGVTNAFKALQSVAQAVKEAFREIFPKSTASDLKSLTSGFENFTKSLIPTEQALNRIKNVARVFAKAIAIIRNAFELLIAIVIVTAIKIKQKIEEISSHFSKFDGIKSKIVSVGAAVMSFVKNIVSGSPLIILFGAVVVSVIKKILGAFFGAFRLVRVAKNSLADMLENLGRIPRLFVSLGKSLKGAIRAHLFREYAVSIAILAGAIALLATADSKKAAISAGIMLGTIAVLTAIYIIFEKLTKKNKKLSKNMASFTSLTTALSAAIMMLAIAIKLLDGIAFGNVQGSVLAIIELLAALTTAGILVSRLSGEKGLQAKTIRTLTVGVLLLAVAVKLLGDITFGNAQKNVLVIVELLAALMGVVIGITRLGKPIIFVNGTIRSLSLSILLLSLAIKLLDTITFGKAQQNVLLIVELLAALMGVVIGISRLGEPIIFVNGTIRALGLSVLMLSLAIKLLDTMTFGSAQKNVLLIVELLASLMGVVIGISRLGEPIILVNGTIRALGTTILLLSLAIKLLDTMTFGSAQKNVLLIVELLAALMGVVIGITRLGKPIIFVNGTIRALGSSILMLSLAIRLISDIPFDKGQASVLALIELMAGLSGAVIMMTKLAGAGKGVLALIAMTASVAVVAAMLSRLTELGDPVGVLAAAGAISGTMMILSVASMIASKAVEGSVAMLLLSVSAILAAASLAILCSTGASPKEMLAAAGAISGVMLVLSIASLIANSAVIGSAAMVALAGAALLAGLSLSLLCSTGASPKEMLAAAGAIVGSLLALSLVTALLGALSPVITVGLIPLAALAATLLIVSTSMLLAATAFAIFSSSLETIGNVIKDLTPVLPEFSSALSAAIHSIGLAVVDGVAQLGKAGFVAMYSAAYNLIAGFGLGLRDGFASVLGLGVLMGSEFMEGFNGRLGIHSPSDETEKSGLFTVLGYVLGIEKNAGQARASGTFLGGEVLAGVEQVTPEFGKEGQKAGDAYCDGLMGRVAQYAKAFGIDMSDMYYSAEKEARLQADYEQALRKKNFYSRQDQNRFKNDTKAWTEGLEAREKALRDYQTRWGTLPNTSEFPEPDPGGDFQKEIDEITNSLGGGGGGGGASGATDKLYVSTGLLKKLLENTTKVFRKYFQEVSAGTRQNGRQSTELEDGFKRSSDAIIRFGAALALASGDMIVSADDIDSTLESVEKSLTDYIGTLRSTVDNQISLFKEFNKGDLIDKNSLTKNLQSQIAGVTKFIDDIAALAQRGLSPTLLKQIAEMGPETGFQYAAAIRSMSDAEVETLNETYKAWDSVKNYAVDDLVSAIALAFSNDENSYDEIGGKIGNEIVDGLLEVLGSQGASSEMKEELNDAISSAVSGFDFSNKVNVRELQNVINNIVHDVVGMYSSINQAAKVSKATDNVLAFATNLAIASKKTEQGVTEIVLSVEELEKALSDYVSSLKSTIDSQMGLFKEFNKGDILNTEEILNSFDSQIEGMSEFMNYIDQLSTRGIDPQLLQSIIDMGPESGYSYAEAIVKMTDDELAALNQKYSQWGGMKDNLADSLTAGLARSFENASSKFQDIGAYAGQQILGSLKRQFVNVGDLGDEVANTLQATLSNPSAYLTEIAEEDITIDVSLVVDDSQAVNAIDDLQKTLNDDVKVGASTTSSMATKASWKKPEESSTNITYNNNYNQTINSPKPLSTIEIYRHTNRLVSTKTEK